MNSQREIVTQLNALSIYLYLQKYTDLEEYIKRLFLKSWSGFSEEFKQRLMFYQGKLTLENAYIEYDTYSIVTQYHKFDVLTLLNKLTLNQIIKLERKENQISDLKYDIISLQNKTIVYPCLDCILKLLNMRNILAHKMNDLNFKNKDYIDVLGNDIISKSDFWWLRNFDLNLLSESARCIVSNYIYMDMILQRLGDNQDDKTVDNGEYSRL